MLEPFPPMLPRSRIGKHTLRIATVAAVRKGSFDTDFHRFRQGFSPKVSMPAALRSGITETIALDASSAFCARQVARSLEHLNVRWLDSCFVRLPLTRPQSFPPILPT
jgi:hypothetical protein